MLTSQTASDYIASYHAPHGGARVAWAIRADVDGIEAYTVKFWHNGYASFATVWLESGRLYGEW